MDKIYEAAQVMIVAAYGDASTVLAGVSVPRQPQSYTKTKATVCRRFQWLEMHWEDESVIYETYLVSQLHTFVATG